MKLLVAALAALLISSSAAAESETAEQALARLESLPDDACAEIHAIGVRLAAEHPDAARAWLTKALAQMDRKVLARALRVARYVAGGSHRERLPPRRLDGPQLCIHVQDEPGDAVENLLHTVQDVVDALPLRPVGVRQLRSHRQPDPVQPG